MRHNYDPPKDGSGEMTLEDYWLAIYRRKWIVAAIVGTAVMFSVVASRFLPARYEASMTFYVPEDVTAPVDSAGKDTGKARLPSGNQDIGKAYSGILKGGDARKAINRRIPSKKEEELSRDVDFVVTREGFIKVYARDESPKQAAEVANAYADFFNDFSRATTEHETSQLISATEDELNGIKTQLRTLTEEKQRLRERYSISSLQTEMEELERSRVKSLSDLAAKGSELKPMHPEIVALKSNIDQSQTRIRQIPGILKKHEEYEEKIRDMSEVRAGLQKKLGDLLSGRAHAKNVAIVISTATPPVSPIFPIMWLNAAVAAVFGLFVGFLYAFFLEYLDVRTLLRETAGGKVLNVDRL